MSKGRIVFENGNENFISKAPLINVIEDSLPVDIRAGNIITVKSTISVKHYTGPERRKWKRGDKIDHRVPPLK